MPRTRRTQGRVSLDCNRSCFWVFFCVNFVVTVVCVCVIIDPHAVWCHQSRHTLLCWKFKRKALLWSATSRVQTGEESSRNVSKFCRIIIVPTFHRYQWVVQAQHARCEVGGDTLSMFSVGMNSQFQNPPTQSSIDELTDFFFVLLLLWTTSTNRLTSS